MGRKWTKARLFSMLVAVILLMWLMMAEFVQTEQKKIIKKIEDHRELLGNGFNGVNRI